MCVCMCLQHMQTTITTTTTTACNVQFAVAATPTATHAPEIVHRRQPMSQQRKKSITATVRVGVCVLSKFALEMSIVRETSKCLLFSISIN